jgi:hypothetical protein
MPSTVMTNANVADRISSAKISLSQCISSSSSSRAVRVNCPAAKDYPDNDESKPIVAAKWPG